jgi:hypothetical protein
MFAAEQRSCDGSVVWHLVLAATRDCQVARASLGAECRVLRTITQVGGSLVCTRGLRFLAARGRARRPSAQHGVWRFGRVLTRSFKRATDIRDVRESPPERLGAGGSATRPGPARTVCILGPSRWGHIKSEFVSNLKRAIVDLPVVGPALKNLRRIVRPRRTDSAEPPFPGSAEYWDLRYRAGRNSGPGSYHRLARFKSQVLNAFVRDHGVMSLIEFGCGDGAQLQLARYPNYVGIDVSAKAIEICREMYKDDPSKRFVLYPDLTEAVTAELTLSLDERRTGSARTPCKAPEVQRLGRPPPTRLDLARVHQESVSIRFLGSG